MMHLSCRCWTPWSSCLTMNLTAISEMTLREATTSLRLLCTYSITCVAWCTIREHWQSQGGVTVPRPPVTLIPSRGGSSSHSGMPRKAKAAQGASSHTAHATQTARPEMDTSIRGYSERTSRGKRTNDLDAQDTTGRRHG